MNGFYNSHSVSASVFSLSCHTAPNERLLQLVDLSGLPAGIYVVIPLQMNGFYNTYTTTPFATLEVVIPLQMNGFYNHAAR